MQQIIRKALKCKPSAHAQLLAHGARLVAWAITIITAMGAIINTHAHRLIDAGPRNADRIDV